MSATAVYTALERIGRHFRMPHDMCSEKGQAWAADYVRALESFENDILDKATDAIVDDYELTTFPRISRIRQACHKVAADMGHRVAAERAIEDKAEFRAVSPTPEGKQRLIDAVIRLRQQKIDGQPFQWDGYEVNAAAGADMIGMAEALHERSKKEDYSYGLMAKECGI